MTVQELILYLQTFPPDLPVTAPTNSIHSFMAEIGECGISTTDSVWYDRGEEKDMLHLEIVGG